MTTSKLSSDFFSLRFFHEGAVSHSNVNTGVYVKWRPNRCNCFFSQNCSCKTLPVSSSEDFLWFQCTYIKSGLLSISAGTDTLPVQLNRQHLERTQTSLSRQCWKELLPSLPLPKGSQNHPFETMSQGHLSQC